MTANEEDESGEAVGPLKPYQKRYPDGFIINKILSKPLHMVKGFVYCTLEEENISVKADGFLPTWDATDHLSFACEKCKSISDVLAVKFDPNYADPPSPRFALFFYLGCPKCGATGQRKIYLDEFERRGFCHKTWHDNKLYNYGMGDDPSDIRDAPVWPDEGPKK